VGHRRQTDFARYLCVALCGYLETAIRELVTEHCRLRAERTVASHASAQLSRFQNPNAQRITGLVAAFDLNWQAQVDDYMADERRNAVDSIMGIRHQIAHGQNVGVTFQRVDEYRKSVYEVVDFLLDMFLPVQQ
jgi:hypothetical protein